jgi:hypothetical protein
MGKKNREHDEQPMAVGFPYGVLLPMAYAKVNASLLMRVDGVKISFYVCGRRLEVGI